ncbi:conserved hypothetical protein [Sporisorium reilianum SRZ2]|uniref:DNA replication regulator SLD2 n=1 Tax=Sporisorium reilianum (strain SRZ2) TaxID=999809 RepID=E6ZKX4_SPORE|nr:conserved hypothetical protein [Sporisorium reilianum SRZ2]
MEQLLRRELKTWQKAFKAQHGRDPTKRDILADPAIAGTYDTWQAAGGDVKAKPKSKSKSSDSASRSNEGASSSKQRLDQREEVFKTPSKKTSTPSRNPFRTPTKSSPSAAGRSRNPFASPAKPAPPSPARSLIEVELTPTKSSPLLDTFARRNNFTPTKSPSHPHDQYITSSPSKLRTTLEASLPARRTPTKTRAESDAALSAALVAYTPRTKARKRLRGEDVPPTPSGRRAATGVRTEPRAVQRGLGAFGFASSRKVTHESQTAPGSASVFSRARGAAKMGTASTEVEDEDMQAESPIKAVARLRRSASSKGFRPLFASPSGNHAPQNILGVPPPIHTLPIQHMADDDADALMDDDTAAPVGGLFAAQVQQRRRARETESAAVDHSGAEAKKHKVRAAVALPSSSDSDDGAPDLASSSPAPFRRAPDAPSSPHTELTVPSSTVRPSAEHAFLSKPNKSVEVASSPTRRAHHSDPKTAETCASTANRAEPSTGGVAWRKVHRVELSDDDEPHKKIISITPYQRYGTLRSSSPHPPSALDDDEEDYYVIPSSKTQVYAVDPSTTAGSDDDDDETHASLAGLKLSPDRQARSRAREQRARLLHNIFDPSSRAARTVFNPEARFGPLQPSTRSLDSDYIDEPRQKHAVNSNAVTLATASDDDDDDWQQAVDEDFTFLDSEIELNDVA